ncbi:MAG: ABC transporter substrate-binding protein [Akkermansiaceae bacterium]|nr:ABC transporter substrate-binding protein [Akkermansiaceae bacterium]
MWVGMWKWLVAALALLTLVACRPEEGESRVVRIGCFPNITHVQALVARHMSRTGEGWFERYVPGYAVEWQTYNAGPSAAEAVFGRTVDLTYIGPSPAINAYAVSAGREMRLLAGAVNGGSALMVRPGAGLARAADFRGRSIATPQLGNTQDVSCRAWLAAHGLSCTLEGGGDVRVAPTASSLQLQLMKQRKLDACWTVEPWVSLLEAGAGAKALVQEPGVVTTVLAGRAAWLRAHPREAAALLRAHRELTQWILDHPEEAQRRVAEELAELTQTPVDPALVASAWKRLTLTTEVDTGHLKQFVREAQAAGLLDRVPPIEGLLWSSLSPTP